MKFRFGDFLIFLVQIKSKKYLSRSNFWTKLYSLHFQPEVCHSCSYYLVKRSLWMGPKQKKRPWLCRIDQSLYCLVIHCCETRGEYHKTFWSACAFGKSHYGWESKWFCGFQHISVIDHITQRVMADRFLCKQKYERPQWPWKRLHKKLIYSFLKFMFSKKTTKIDKIFTIHLTLC